MSRRERTDSDRISCPNCGTNHDRDHTYCPQCGQKNVSSRITIAELLQELTQSIFNIDARIIVTLRDLWKPGALTRSYFEGRRKKYIHPVRLFLFSLLFLLLAFSYSFDKLGGINTDTFYIQTQRQVAKKDLLRQIDSIYSEQLTTGEQTAKDRTDSFYLAILHRSNLLPDSIQSIPDSIPELGDGSTTGLQFDLFWMHVDFSIEDRDLATMSIEELLEKYSDGSFWNDLWLEQYLKAYKSPRALMYYLLGSITWIYLFLMPVIALFIAFLFIRSRRFFVEHLIFSIHVQTVSSILIGLSLFIYHWFDWSLLLPAIAISLLYLLLAQKWYYRQGWFKTLTKYVMISTTYAIAWSFL